MVCEFKNECKYYDEDSYTCNDDGEHCGTYNNKMDIKFRYKQNRKVIN
jgi:hypothetical protein